MPRLFLGAASASLAAVLALSAHAHVTLDPPQAAADSYFKMNVRVPHGCEGTATLRVRVRIPEGVFGVKPQPKPGWELSTVKTKLNPPVKDGHGREITEVVSEIVWSGGKLLDEHYDEFVFRARLPDGPAGTVIWFPVVQQCETGVHRWIEIPAAGKSIDDYKEPATFIKLLGK